MQARLVQILVADDDPRILLLERQILEKERYAVLAARDGQEALDLIVEKAPQLILVDVHMPRVDGLTVCRLVREFSQLPIIVVTVMGSDDDKVLGFEAGADDYITKPFLPKEFIARVKAVLRRTSVREGLGPLADFGSGDLLVEFAKHRVTIGEREIALSGTEYRLLAWLAQNAGSILTPDQILERVWGEEYVGEAHLLRVTIGRLREKLGDDARNPTYLLTRPGIGYSLKKVS